MLSVKGAKECGADIVKFQKRDINLVYPKELLNLLEKVMGKNSKRSKEGLEFGKDENSKIDEYCKKENIDWFASAWDLNSQNFLKDFNCKYNKIASAMLIYDDLLKAVAKEKKHTFISTGMSNYEDIDKAVKIFRDNDCPFELMHCVSTYPMPEEIANLKLISTLKNRYSCNVGYSGHEAGVSISCAAAALGITSLERHITLDRAMYGSDQAASLELSGFRNLVGAVRKIGKAMGDGVKKIDPTEVPIAKKLRIHIKGLN